MESGNPRRVGQEREQGKCAAALPDVIHLCFSIKRIRSSPKVCFRAHRLQVIPDT